MGVFLLLPGVALRYTNFFEDDVDQRTKLDVLLDGKKYRSHEMAIMTSFTMGAATARLSVANNAVATIDGKAISGGKRRAVSTRMPYEAKGSVKNGAKLRAIWDDFDGDVSAHGGDCQRIEWVAMDMLHCYAKGVREHFPRAQIVYDKAIAFANRRLVQGFAKLPTIDHDSTEYISSDRDKA